MSTYPFPHIRDHKTYEITFLESVIIKLDFNGEKNRYEHFCNYVCKEFGVKITPERYDVLDADPLRLRDSQRFMTIKFSCDSIELVISGNAYRNFHETASSLMLSFSRFLSEIGSEAIRLSMEMIDVWPFQKDTAINTEVAFATFFSREFFNSLNCGNGGFRSKEFKNETSGDSVVVKCGCIRQSEDYPTQPDRLILDSIAIAKSPFDSKSLLDASVRLNNTLYDVFHWAVTENVINAMINPRVYEKD